MSILISKSTRVLVQGITGREGRLHSRRMIAYGTNVVAGVTPGKGGEWVEGKPIFDTVKAAIQATDANTSVVFVPAAFAADAIYEAVDNGIELIVCITEGIPAIDMMKVKAYLASHQAYLVGPNSPGLLIPGSFHLGIIPTYIAHPGRIGVVSRSGTLMYDVIATLTQAGLGQSTCIGIGGDPIVGMSIVEVLELFENDPDTEKVVLIGEIGGQLENEAANFIKASMTKPVVAYIAGKTAPENRQMGHAGALISAGIGTANEKIENLKSAGARIAHNPDHIPDLLR